VSPAPGTDDPSAPHLDDAGAAWLLTPPGYPEPPMAMRIPGPRRTSSKPPSQRVPSLRFENDRWREGAIRVVGVDEVGVAPTCGAVVAAAVIMRPHARRIPGVRDSKTLSALQRERLAPLIRRRAVAVGVGAASVREIDTVNIYHATHLAMRRAIARVGGHDHVLVDGNRIQGFEAKVGPYTAIVDGDARCYSIACASVVAKVVRDRMMALLAARYPGYGWERNQGYATREHRDAIRRLGLTPFHRRSFLALQRTLAGDQISLDLFDEALEGFEQADELGELDRLDGLRSDRLGEGLDGMPALPEIPGEVGAAAIAEAEAILREANELPSARGGPEAAP
jgi:ribonuclease HII